MRPFEYLAPTRVSEALDMLAQHGSKAMIMAGGTDVMLELKERTVNPEYVIHLAKVQELKFIKEENDCIKIGPLVTMNEIAESKLIQEKLTALAKAAINSAAPQVRNLGTIGGNLGTASPAGDLITALTALGAKIKASSLATSIAVTNEYSMEEFLLGPKKNVLTKDQLITEIVIPNLPPNSASAFQKLGKRKAMSISIASAAAVITLSPEGKNIRNVRVAMGSLAPTAVRAKKFETAVQGKEADLLEIKKASSLVKEDVKPITDVRAKGEYRREVAEVLVYRCIENALTVLKNRV